MLGSEIATPEFAELYTLFVRTRAVFRTYWEQGGSLEREETTFLATRTLSHIDDIDFGFRWTLRTEHTPGSELAHLLKPEDLTNWEREPSGTGRIPVAPDMRKVMALRHAQVVFGYIPRTPRGDVSYPGFSSYSDIRVPRTPMELRERIEELAIGVWDTAACRSAETLDPERARRVYGFFEAGSSLTSSHMKRIRRQ